MKTKGLIKKTLTAGMLALMACASMSAMAEKQLVYVGPFKVYSDWFTDPQYAPDDLQRACESFIERRREEQLGGKEFSEARNVQFINLYSSGSPNGYIICSFESRGKVYGEWTPWFPIEGGFGHVRCTQGGYIYPDHFDGCYEYSDCNPASYPNGDMPAGCMSFDLCDIKISNGSVGGLACDKPSGEVKKVCVWKPNILTDYPNEKAAGIIGQCVELHEKDHLKALDDLVCNQNRRGIWSRDSALNECDGHIVELECLDAKIADNACENDADCKTQLDIRHGHILERVAGDSIINRACSSMTDSFGTRYYGKRLSYFPPKTD